MSRRERLRRHVGSAVVDGFFRGASRLGALHPHAKPELHGVRVVRDVPFRFHDHPDHRLDLYHPTGAVSALRTGSWAPPLPEARPPRRGPDGRLPAVLYVHGGGFRILSKDTHWLAGLMFARDGWVCANTSYRLAPRDRYPAAIEDVCAAWCWLVRNAPALGIDTDRIVLAGESAGANLVTALAIATTFRRPEPWAREVFELGVVPRAILPAMGILQVSDPERFQRRKPLPSWLFDRIQEVSTAYLAEGESGLADPLLVLEGDEQPERPFPAVWAVGGTSDPILDDTRRLHIALGRRGVPHEVSYWRGGVHAGHMFVFRSEARQVWAEMLAFADRALSPPAPTR